jgi:hypothetical protein
MVLFSLDAKSILIHPAAARTIMVPEPRAGVVRRTPTAGGMREN